MLPNGIQDNSGATPIECLGPATPFMRVVYQGGDVRRVGWQEFSNVGSGQAVSSVDAGVVEFASDTEAQRLFADFAARWKSCEGTTVRSTLPGPANTELYQKITDVRVDGPLVSATVINSDNQGDAAFPIERAIGWRPIASSTWTQRSPAAHRLSSEPRAVRSASSERCRTRSTSGADPPLSRGDGPAGGGQCRP